MPSRWKRLFEANSHDMFVFRVKEKKKSDKQQMFMVMNLQLKVVKKQKQLFFLLLFTGHCLSTSFFLRILIERLPITKLKVARDSGCLGKSFVSRKTSFHWIFSLLCESNLNGEHTRVKLPKNRTINECIQTLEAFGTFFSLRIKSLRAKEIPICILP